VRCSASTCACSRIMMCSIRCSRASDSPVCPVVGMTSWKAGRIRSGPPRTPYVITGMMRIATMLATLIMGLMAGPAVSLNGSPTVSPVTDAACASEPLPP
jgi:hypothetical protein